MTRTHGEDSRRLGRICIAKVSSESRIGCTVDADIVEGDPREGLCFEITIDYETSMVRIPQANLTHESEMNDN
jgi:hypothetical protein